MSENMADEDVVDIEGDFELNLGAESSIIYDPNEPPSKTVNLQPEYSQHPWMLEQGWSLDHCADEKSKAAIERMLKEEQQFLNGKGPYHGGAEGTSLPRPTKKAVPQKCPWTEEEKELFFKGLEIYGRSWSRIAELIPTRKVQQVKNFGQQYFKMQARLEELEKMSGTSVDSVAPSVEEMMKVVTTAQTTVPVQTTIRQHHSGKPLGRQRKTSHSKRVAGRTASFQGSFGESNCETESVSSVPQLGEEVCTIVKYVKDGSLSESDVDIDIDDEVVCHSRDHDYSGDEVYRKLVQAAGIPVEDVQCSTSNSNSPTPDSFVDKHAGNFSDLDTPNLQDNWEEPFSNKETSNTEKFQSMSEVKEDVLIALDFKDYGSKQVGRKLELPSQSCDKGRDIDHSTTISPPLIDDSKTIKDENNMDNVDKLSPDDIVTDVNAKHTTEDAASTLPCEKAAMAVDCPSSNITDHTDDFQVEELMESDSQEEHINECAVYTSNGEEIYLPNPTKELTLESEAISQEEKFIHSEFFDHRSGVKRPERYLKIRNYIIDAWLKCRPTFLNKTSVRPGLKHCGDVNCIGRIHGYLEQIGAINFGCVQAQYNRFDKPSSRKRPKTDKSTCIVGLRAASSVHRKRRVRDVFGEWVDEKDLEGRTIEHRDVTEKKTRIRQVRNPLYDPFKLIPCQDFSTDHPAPFCVEIDCSAVVVMDTHAHLSKTEVIGLLGGQFHKDEDKLYLTIAEPCESLSTGMQCEMDPVSQTEASERIAGKGYNVVGWYHSHPTFDPNPSVRDIETQEKFQDWFARGGSPFVGIIVSPYGHNNTNFESQIRCLIVRSENYSTDTSGMPYQFDLQVNQQSWNQEYLLGQLKNLIGSFASRTHRVEMLHHFQSLNNVLCVDKLISSLMTRIHLMQSTKSSAFLDQVRDIITSAFCDETNESLQKSV